MQENHSKDNPVAWLDKSDLKQTYNDSKTEAHIWREAYPAYERLADNDLLENLDPNLPEVNDGSLAAALFKLPKRVYKPLTGTIKSIDRDEAWLSELANLEWQNEIIPNAITQAPFDRKWKDSIRKAAIYGSVPLITLSCERNGKTYTDFIIGQPQDVTLEPGKVSDYDSDVMFWDVYYTQLQWENMIEQAKKEQKEHKQNLKAYDAAKVTKPIGTADAEDTDTPPEPYNTWDIPAMELILKGDFKEERSSLDTPRQEQDKNVRPKGIKICITFQRGVSAPFYMYHSATDSTPRQWSNPDPTGDVPIHFLYCYQDFINPYGIGIVKLAGGTQNVLDYMRQADVLATQLGLRPPINVAGSTSNTDIESLVYAQDAIWFTGEAVVKREELANGVYNQLPARIQMYQTSLQKIIPTGDTSASASNSGDPTQSKTPAGVKLQAANLSIDDEDFKDNLYVTYEAVAKSMINTHFANMEGEDIRKLSDDEREILMKAGLDFPKNANGEMSNQMQLVWDTVRAKFDFRVDPEQDKAADDADKLAGLTKVAELAASDPTFVQDLAAAGKKFNKGELMSEIVSLTSDNDKIITDISPDEQQQAEQQPQTDPNAPHQKTPSESVTFKDAVAAGAIDSAAAMLEQAGLPAADLKANGQAQQQLQQQSQQLDQATQMKALAQPETPQEQTQEDQEPSHGGVSQAEIQANVDAVMKQYGVSEQTALTALAAEHQGLPVEDVINHLQSLNKQGVPA